MTIKTDHNPLGGASNYAVMISDNINTLNRLQLIEKNNQEQELVNIRADIIALSSILYKCLVGDQQNNIPENTMKQIFDDKFNYSMLNNFLSGYLLETGKYGAPLNPEEAAKHYINSLL